MTAQCIYTIYWKEIIFVWMNLYKSEMLLQMHVKFLNLFGKAPQPSVLKRYVVTQKMVAFRVHNVFSSNVLNTFKRRGTMSMARPRGASIATAWKANTVTSTAHFQHKSRGPTAENNCVHFPDHYIVTTYLALIWK